MKKLEYIKPSIEECSLPTGETEMLYSGSQDGNNTGDSFSNQDYFDEDIPDSLQKWDIDLY